jgi:DNA-binding CsgD family transcriptional regulator
MTTVHSSLRGREKTELTPCEFQVCYELVNTALVHKQIAAKLGKSVKTVEVQIASAYKKLRVTSRCELIQRFNNEREVPVNSAPSKGLLNRLMQRLDNIERLLNDLLREGNRSPAAINRISYINSAERIFSRGYAPINVNEGNPTPGRRRACS